MIFKSQLLTQASGSVGGLTFSRNKGGAYTRARAVPINPNTPFQQIIRNAVASLSNLWVNVLTPTQRAEWDLYAANVPILNALGDPINLTGLNMYIRSNTPRLLGADPRADTGPGIFDVGEFTSPSFLTQEATDTVDVTFTDTDAWANEDNSSMMVYASRPQNPSINFFKGPYRFAAKIEGDAITPPSSPASIALPFPLIPGQRVFYRVNVTRADGRLSNPFRDFDDG